MSITFRAKTQEINLANGNAMDVIKMFKLPEEWCGECDPHTILDGVAFIRSLNAAGHEPLVKDTIRQGNFIHAGRTPEQIQRYLDQFKAIALEAIALGINVSWC